MYIPDIHESMVSISDKVRTEEERKSMFKSGRDQTEKTCDLGL